MWFAELTVVTDLSLSLSLQDPASGIATLEACLVDGLPVDSASPEAKVPGLPFPRVDRTPLPIDDS